MTKLVQVKINLQLRDVENPQAYLEHILEHCGHVYAYYIAECNSKVED